MWVTASFVPSVPRKQHPDQVRQITLRLGKEEILATGLFGVYDINGLQRIPTWQTLNLVKDAYFVYDTAEIEGIFKKILQKAEEHGIVYDSQEKVFSLKMAQRVIFS